MLFRSSPSTDTVVSIDRSGSMSSSFGVAGGPTKLQAAADAVKAYINEQRRGTENRVGMLTFDDELADRVRAVQNGHGERHREHQRGDCDREGSTGDFEVPTHGRDARSRRRHLSTRWVCLVVVSPPVYIRSRRRGLDY